MLGKAGKFGVCGASWVPLELGEAGEVFVGHVDVYSRTFEKVSNMVCVEVGNLGRVDVIYSDTVRSALEIFKMTKTKLSVAQRK